MDPVTSYESAPTVEYVFDELHHEKTDCQLCKNEVAVYRWSQYGTGGNQRNLPVCRVCAGMILLVGKSS